MFPNINNNKSNDKADLRLLSNFNGIVVLEYAVIAMIGLPLLLLLLDVGNVLRIKASLQEGVKRTLRCLTPLEADCVDNLEEGGGPLYEVEVKSAKPSWPLPVYFYSLNSDGLYGARHSFDNPIARVLSHTRYESRDVGYILNEKADKLNVRLDYNLKTSNFPYVDIGESDQGALNPKFVYQKSQSKNYPRENIDISHVGGNVSQISTPTSPHYKLIGRVYFTVPIHDSLPCFISRNIDSVSALQQANFDQECNLEKIETALHITGAFPVDPLAQGSRGRVRINLRGNGLSINGQTTDFKSYNLGGRAFTYDSNNTFEPNFIPRGVPENNISKKSNFQEFKLYQNIFLQAGESYTLEFYLQRTNDVGTRTGWRGKKLKLFFPQVRKLSEEYLCEDKNTLIEDKGGHEIKTCQYLNVNGQGVPKKYLLNTSLESKTEVKHIGCHSTAQILEVCKGCTYKIDTNYFCPQTSQRVTPCPSNFGTKLDPNTTSFAEAEMICPIKDPQKVGGTKQVYYERDLVLPDVTLNYEQQSCSEALTPKLADYPESVRNYQKVTWKKGAVSVGKQIDTKGIKPSKFKIDNPEMNCAAFQVKNKKYDFNNSSSGIPRSLSSSMLVGAHSELITGCNWEESVADEAREKLGLDQFDYLDVSRELAGYEYLDEKPELSCYGYLPQKEIAVGDIDGTKNLGPFTKDQIPDICQDPSVSCQIKLVGFQGGGGDDFKWNESLAVKKGYEALKAAYSGAKINCERTDPNCFNMDINFDGKRFDVYASMELPLLSLLGKKQIKLNFRSQGIYQGALLDSGR